MLGNHNLALIAQANGTLKDIGGQVSYLNQKNRFNYGAAAGHIPILYGYLTQGFEPILDENGEVTGLIPTYDQVFRRIFIDQVDFIGSYPLSTTRRFELSGGFARYAEDIEIRRYFQTLSGLTQGERINRDDLEGDPFYFFQAGAAVVGDNSSFGFTSPVRGGRFRLQVSPYVGSDDYVRILGDYRRYFLAKPFTFAIRGLHVGNYGAAETSNTSSSSSFDSNIFTRQYLGYPNYLGFVRGYSFNSFAPEECTPLQNSNACLETSRLIGTRIALASAEVRIPLFGSSGFGLINFPYLPTEINLFFDAGMAWNEGEHFFKLLKFDRDGIFEEEDILQDGTQVTTLVAKRIPVFSTGVSTRFNLFGYTVLELFYAYPFQRPDKGAHLGFQLIPGW